MLEVSESVLPKRKGNACFLRLTSAFEVINPSLQFTLWNCVKHSILPSQIIGWARGRPRPELRSQRGADPRTKTPSYPATSVKGIRCLGLRCLLRSCLSTSLSTASRGSISKSITSTAVSSLSSSSGVSRATTSKGILLNRMARRLERSIGFPFTSSSTVGKCWYVLYMAMLPRYVLT